MKSLKLENSHSMTSQVISDSGYLSHTADENHVVDQTLSEQTIHAMLKPQGFRGKQDIYY